MDNFQWILAYDGDSAGRLVGRAILSNNLSKLSEVSARINLGHELVHKWAMDHGGSVISGGGDEGTFQIPHEALEFVEQLRHDYHFATQLTMSLGVGQTLSEAGKSLLAAKFRGKNQTVFYDFSVEDELQKVKNNLEEGIASEAERKNGEAYLQPQEQETVMDGKDKMLNKNEEEDDAGGPVPLHDSERIAPTDGTLTQEHDCPYCSELQAQNITDEDCPYCTAPAAHDPNADGHTDDCQYCAVMNHDPDAEDHAADCQYCAEMDTHDPAAEGHPDDCPYCASSHDPNMEGHPDDCQYCARAGANAGGDDQTVLPSPPSTQILPTTTTSQNYEGQDFARPSMDKPAAISSVPSGLGVNTDSPTNENIKLQDLQGEESEIPQAAPEMGQEAGPEGQDTVQSIVAEIDAIPTNEVPERPKVEQADAADLPDGANMEDNVSRPENYSQDVPTDLGTGQQADYSDSPDVTSVLREGLDNHADNIQREKVMEMVGEALEGFKASKKIIERAKMEAPQFYQSSIAMLRAMIEMCKMLGLDQDAAAEESGVMGPEGKIDEPIFHPENQVEDPETSYEAQMSHPGDQPMGGPDSAEQDGHPNYANLFPPHPDGKDGTSDPKPPGQ